jgi:hypothetical protein
MIDICAKEAQWEAALSAGAPTLETATRGEENGVSDAAWPVT